MSSKVVSLGDIAISIRNGKSIKQSPNSGGLPITRIETIATGQINMKKCGYANLKESENKEWLLEYGDILISHINSVKHLGKCAIFESKETKLIHGMNLLNLKIDQSKACPKYIYYVLKSAKFLSQLTKITKKSVNQASFNISSFQKLLIPLPHLDEQRRIIKILDKAKQIIFLANLHQVKAKALPQSIFSETFTQASLFNSEWPILELSEIVKKGTIISYGIVQAGDEYPGGVPYVRTGDISNNEISLNGLRHTSPEIALNFKRTTIYENDILMSIRATVGTTALVPKILEGSNLSRGIALISPGDKVTSEYLLYFLRSSKTQNWIQRQVKGATFREITLKRLRELPVVIPPISIQRDFSKKVKKYNDHLIKIANFRNFLTEFYQSLESDLINSAR